MVRPVNDPARNSLLPRRRIDPRQDLPALERDVLDRWRDRDVFAASLRARENAPPWVFYEGPPTANARPGLHHVWPRAFKDLFIRYQTMRGHDVPRKGGWDCHGLPVEIEVEVEAEYALPLCTRLRQGRQGALVDVVEPPHRFKDYPQTRLGRT